MNSSEEHILIRSFLQRLGSTYVYRDGTLTGDYNHQPVKIVIGSGGPVSKAARAPVRGPEPPPTNRPNALEFALSSQTAAPEPAPSAAPEPAPSAAPEPAPSAAPEPAPSAAPEPAPSAAPRTPVIIPTRKYRRIFSYYGSKSKIAHLYPIPTYDVVIEPFAGSASYSALHYERQIHINEKDAVTASVWRFLLRQDAMECVERWFPKETVQVGTPIVDLFPLDVDHGFVNLIRAEYGQGAFGLDGVRLAVSPWGARDQHQILSRIQYWIPRIQHWTLTTLDYSEIINHTATWFVDPPYNNAAGSIYRTRGLNYSKLAAWCMNRNGQVTVCENEGAAWLPFRFLTKRAGSFTGRDEVAAASGGEVIWEKGIDPIIDIAVETNALAFALSTTDNTSAEIILTNDLRSRGHQLLTRDGKLFISEASRLSDDDRAAIKEHKPALLALAQPWTEPVALPPEPPAIKTAPARPAPETWVEPPRDLVRGVYNAPVKTAPPRYAEPIVAKTAPARQGSVGHSLADFLGMAPARDEWVPQEIPTVLPDQIVLNFAATGLNWQGDDEPIGVTIGTLDGQKRWFLPWGFADGNLPKEQVISFLQDIRGKHIVNSKIKFDIHMGRKIGVDFEGQDNTVADIQHYAALLDDHRRKFALDVLAKDYLGVMDVPRVDESLHASYSASQVANRELYTAKLVSDLREKMWPEMDKQDLHTVRQLEENVIYAVVEMEKNGVQLDMDLVQEYHDECVRRHDQIMLEVSQEVGFNFEHTASGWQRLFEHLGLPPTKGNSEKVIGVISHPTVKRAYKASQYASLDSKTFAAYLAKADSQGVFRYDINQLANDDGGTVSGRFSIGYMQQVPNHDNHFAAFGEDLYPRRCVIETEGECIEADAMQIEYRFFSHYAENKEVLDAYAADPYMSFHRKTEDMLNRVRPIAYSHVKNYNFATMYGAKIIKLATMMGFITEAEGEEIRNAQRWDDPRLAIPKEIENAYRKIMPEKDMLLNRAAHLAKPFCDDYCKKGDQLHRNFPHRGYVMTICGRRSRFDSGYKTYIALNRVLQGGAADWMKKQLAILHKMRRETGMLMRLTVHDAVLGRAYEGTKEKVAEILDTQVFPLKVPILSSVHTGANWAACKG